MFLVHICGLVDLLLSKIQRMSYHDSLSLLRPLRAVYGD